MKTITRFTLLLIGLLFTLTSQAQYDPNKVCRIENGQLIFSLNLNWTEKEKKEVSKLFDLDSALIGKAYQGIPEIVAGGDTWKVKKVKTNLIELSKPIQSNNEKSLEFDDMFVEIDKWMNFNGKVNESSVVYGINDFKITYVFLYNQKTARFYLPAYKSAREVYISGSFNGWSTTQTPMQPVNDGWMIDLNLKPGKYSYKYIVDGKWITDPNNKLRELGDAGDYNSIVYCNNHRFEIKGYKNAHKVVVTGNFYSWNPAGIALSKTADGWALPIYLRDGTYAYKFLVDNEWMPDPANDNSRSDADGNINSFIRIGEPYLFKLNGFSDAKKVILTGSFNNWSRNELMMDQTDKGWQLSYSVTPGNYEYKFIVDGQWTNDPSNPFTTGSGDTQNSFIALKANHLFELNKYPDATTVIVTGSFNGWKTQDFRMIQKGGKWIFPLYLKPGKYTYKFIVDGTWILDPSNDLYEANEYNTDNSVLWIE